MYIRFLCFVPTTNDCSYKGIFVASTSGTNQTNNVGAYLNNNKVIDRPDKNILRYGL
jgi:hypothetical protein